VGDLARLLTRQLQAQEVPRRPMGAGNGCSCHARLTAVDGDFQGASAAIGQVLSERDRLPMPFEHGSFLSREHRDRREVSARSGPR